MLILTLATYMMIQSFQGNYIISFVLSYWILISPFPSVVMLGRKFIMRVIPITGALAPINIQPIMAKFTNLFSSVAPEKKIFMAFLNPGNEYVKVFDGLRFHIEFPLYVASQKKILLFPDWMAVSQNNFVGAPNFWGKEPHEVEKNLIDWNADYAMIYQNGLTELEQKWNVAGFKVISHCTWKSDEIKPMDGSWFPYMDLSWWLIQK